MAKLRIAVLMGGDSAEREVSLLSGKAVLAGLDRQKYEPVPVELTAVPKRADALPEVLRNGQVDVAFIALHGGAGEDGRLQDLLEQLGLPYTGSGPRASAQAMNKTVSKHIFRQAGIPTPRGKGFMGLTAEKLPAVGKEVLQFPGLPVVVKPACQGSTIGVSIVQEEKDLLAALQLALRYGPDLLVEKFIAGKEITAALLGNSSPRVLPLIEIVPKSGFYDYHAKYLAADTEKIVPARLPEEVAKAAQQAALKAYLALGCRGFGRVDMIARDKEIFVLEVNTIPGMTGDHSLVPCAARAAGIDYSALLDFIIKFALEEGPGGFAIQR